MAALIVDLDGLLRRRRVVARGRGLQDEPVNGSEDQQLAHEVRHCRDVVLRIERAVYRGIGIGMWSSEDIVGGLVMTMTSVALT